MRFAYSFRVLLTLKVMLIKESSEGIDEDMEEILNTAEREYIRRCGNKKFVEGVIDENIGGSTRL